MKTAATYVLTLLIGAILGVGGTLLAIREPAELTTAPEACVQDMRRQFVEAQATGAQGSRPESCEGVSEAALTAVAGQIMADELQRQASNS